MPREKTTPHLTRKCPVCAGGFSVSSERSLAVYCSNACKQQAYLAKLKGKSTPVSKSKPAPKAPVRPVNLPASKPLPEKKQPLQPVAAPVSKPAPKQKQMVQPAKAPPFSEEKQASLLLEYYNLHDEEITVKAIGKLLKKFEKHLDKQDDWLALFETAFDDLQETYENTEEGDRFTFNCVYLEELEEFLEEMGLIE